ncbi:maleate cis-trans isomerase family protein [Ovoidimarina sediminis]|uniref:maleate cis-trans isomerase family protein n=1 Tax=Ovoidimarina sediminis TaxID=3079856 RepID=UPI00290F4A8B|nr:Asp/Glu racemase [Rhodophyticola sp. MJ-SS7]MDU8942191.1 Asp/Glu racemase [Rhodophyticola sp. MJ-SS7]
MSRFDYTVQELAGPKFGLLVLQADETIERDFRRLMPAGAELLVSRVPSAVDVTPETLAAMKDHLTAAATLFPDRSHFDVVGYGCTSATAEIGANRVAEQIGAGVKTDAVTEPLSALVAACKSLEVSRIGFLSPYLPAVSNKLRDVLASRGIESPLFGSFDEAIEARVVRIDGASIRTAARTLARKGEVDGIFLSCTNLRTLDVIPDLQRELDMPVLSSNLVLAWHMLRLAGEGPVSPDQLLSPC